MHPWLASQGGVKRSIPRPADGSVKLQICSTPPRPLTQQEQVLSGSKRNDSNRLRETFRGFEIPPSPFR